MTRLRGRRPTELRDEERGDRRADEAEDERASRAAEEHDAHGSRDDDGERHRPPAGCRIANRAPQVPHDGSRPSQLLAPAADADVEPPRQDEVGEPERDAEHENGGARDDCLPDPVAGGEQDVHRLPREQEDPVRVRGHHGQRRCDPDGPAATPAALERSQQRERAGEREEEEEAVHPTVDAVEEEEPARRDDCRGDEPDQRAAETAAESGDERKAGERERGRHHPQAPEPEPEVGDGPREEEVERRAAPLARHVLDDPGQRVPADEQCERLVLVRRPRHQLMQEEAAGNDRDPADAQPHPVPRDPRRHRRTRRRAVRPRLETRLDPLRHRGFRHPRW